MSRTGISAALAAFVILTVAFGASTAYLVASPPVQTHTSVSTVLSTSTATQFATQITTSTATVTTTTFGVSTVSSGDTVNIAYKAGIGFYLVDGTGMTLYFRTTDDQATGTSGCTGACVNIWPVFHPQNLVLPPGLSASAFTTVTRSDGAKQIDFNGWPLYYYSGDAAPGDTNGQGLFGIWFAYTLPAPGLTTTTSTSSSSPTTTTTTSSMATSTTSTATSDATTSTTTVTTTSTTTHTSTTTSCYYYC